MNKASTHFHEACIRLQGVDGPPCSRIHLGLFFQSDPQLSMIFPDLFYTISHNENVLICMELIISHLILLIIYIFYGGESPWGNAYFTITLIIHLDEWQKAHLKQKQRGYKAWSLEDKGENDSIDICKLWIYHLTLSGTSLAWSKGMCTPSPSELNSGTNTSFLPHLPCQMRQQKMLWAENTSFYVPGILGSLTPPKSGLYPHPSLTSHHL